MAHVVDTMGDGLCLYPFELQVQKEREMGYDFGDLCQSVCNQFWHKASWGYVLFGLYHATLFIPIILKNVQAKDLELKWIKGWILHPLSILKAVGVYLLVTIGSVFARADTFGDIIASFNSWFAPWGLPSFRNSFNIRVFVLCGLIVVIKDYLDEMGAKYSILKSNKPVWVVIGLVLFAILIFFLRGDVPQEFIYKQF